jgi:hypothetical protein
LRSTQKEAARFWPIHESFERELERSQRKYRQAVIDYVFAQDSLTDANARRLAEQVLNASMAYQDQIPTECRPVSDDLPRVGRYRTDECSINPDRSND